MSVRRRVPGIAAAVAVAAAAGCTAGHGPSQSAVTASSSVPAASVASSASATGVASSASGPAAGPGPAGSCTGAPLKSQLAASVRGGASVIVAVGTLTGKSVNGDPVTAGAPAFYAMTLRSVRTLRGPAVASGSAVWIPGPARGTRASTVNSALLAPGGRLFAIVWPKAATHYPVGPTLQLAPIVGADVVFTPYVCWNLDGLQPNQYQASTPLLSVPGGTNFGGMHQAAENGVYTLPLATVEQIAASA